MINKALSVFLFVVLLPLYPPPVPPDQFVVWNVGQGQWATLAIRQSCFHFDMGGEFADWDAIESLCRKRDNKVYFSHWDLDHISFARKASRRLRALCIVAAPNGLLKQKWKRGFLEAIPSCENAVTNEAPFASSASSVIREITPRTVSSSDPNSSSRVYAIAERIVVPGDSTKESEKNWSQRVPKEVVSLVLGHHGSRTSTSDILLRNLPNLKMAIASARRRKYGHPHPLIVGRVRSRGAAVLSTEDWGHLRLEIPSRSLADGSPAKTKRIKP